MPDKRTVIYNDIIAERKVLVLERLDRVPPWDIGSRRDKCSQLRPEGPLLESISGATFDARERLHVILWQEFLPAKNQPFGKFRSEEHTSELQSQSNLVC